MMVVPIRTLTAGAARIGAGTLDHRIAIKTGDELETLGEQFNHMATQLQGSYATLERKVEERTHQLQVANLAKSRFLAAASHDLRQPLHALNLFVAQLRDGDRSGRARPRRRADRSRRRQHERAVQRTARHLQTRCRRAQCQLVGIPGEQYFAAHRSHLRRRRARKGAGASRGAEQRLDPQRRHSAGARAAQSGVQCDPLYAEGWGRSWLPARRRPPAHRRLRQRRWHPRRISSGTFSANFTRSQRRNRASATDWGSGSQSSNACAPC